MKKQWIVQPRTKDDLIDQLLINRDIDDEEAFLNPKYEDLHDPKRLKGMDRLIERLTSAIEQKEKIAIFGDYDHDGTPAAALLSEGINRCGGIVARAYIPTREEGYSISQAVIEQFIAEGITLLIMVDCGITNKPEVDFAADNGLACIVVDHHVVQEDKYPDKAIVVNPKQKGDTYPFKELCACGLAFKVIQVLGEHTGKIGSDQMKWFLDLVAISTVCDMVPLISENRTLVHFGLLVLKKTKRVGLKKLYEAAGIEPATISTYTVGFMIGPRLNAPGRMERASIAYELLIASKEDEAVQLASRLNELNMLRQQELDRVLQEAEAAIEEKELHKKKVILVQNDAWPDGVVGLVAGRLMDKYGRPSIVLGARDDFAKGSARSIDGFHLVEKLQECEKYLLKYGGHAKAAGLTLAKDQLETLYDRLIQIAEKTLTDEHLTPKLRIDTKLRADEVSLDVAKRLTLLEPHGLGNPRPTFLIEQAEVVDCRKIGAQGNHLKLQLLVDGKVAVGAIAFNFGSRFNECQPGQQIDIVGTLDVNEWQNRQSVQVKVLDFQSSTKETKDYHGQNDLNYLRV